MEKKVYYEWRKGLAHIEETYYTIRITPYEKNLDVWRQLWRTIEKSEILVQIVDGRDPLFYKCEDLENYVKEIDPHKYNFLLINKSDLLSDKVRKRWNQYFLKNNINHMFFSAMLEQSKINEELMGDLNLQIEDELLNTPTIASRRNLLMSLNKIVTEIRKVRISEFK